MKPAEIFARAVELVTGKGPTSRADVEAALHDCEARAIAASIELERMAAQRPELLVGGSDVDVEKHDAMVARTSLERDRATEIAAKLRERLAAIAAAEALATREQRRADVELQCEMAADALRQRYPKAVAEVRAILRTLAKAQSARESFRAAYPSERAIGDPETLARTAPPALEAVVSERKEWRWAHLDGRAVHDSMTSSIRLRLTAQQKAEVARAEREAYHKTGSAQLPKPLYSTEITSRMLDDVEAGRGRELVFETPYGDQVRYVEMVRREVRRSSRVPHPLPLASTISLPALHGSGEHDAWSPASRRFESGVQVLAELDQPRAQPYRALVVEYVAIPR